METWIVIGVLIPILILGESSAITRLSSARPSLVEEWRLNYEKNYDRDHRSVDEYPSPQLPWEEALRHSIYLTLVRDKIDLLLTKKDPNIENHEETDINLWRELRKAPFKAHNKERGPIFGDIAILSRGKLVETHHGLVFIEDENAKECIECHIFSARPNELEAEKTLGNACKGADCENSNVKALWTVRRIRHRNHGENKSPYRYELMFSIASAKSDHDNLDYNVPTQTFTIMETDRSVPMTNLYKKNTKHTTFEEEFFKLHNEKNKAYDQYEPHTEKSYWVHKTIDYRQQAQTPKNTIHFPEYENYQVYNKPILNTGEIYTEQYQNGGIKQPSYYENIFTQNSKNRGPKKFEKSDKVYLENNYNVKKNRQQPTITHLHHHYYLNDKGVPILKFIPPETSKHYYETHYINGDDESATQDIQTNPRKTNIYSSNPEIYSEDSPVSGSTANTRVNPVTIPIYIPEPLITENITRLSTRPITLQMTKTDKLKLKPTKPFTPSQEDFKIRYSELDPLYPPTLSTPSSYITEAQILFKDTNAYDNIRPSESTFLPTISPSVDYSTKQTAIESSAIATNTLSTITANRVNDFNKNIKNHKFDGEEVIAIPIEYSTKKISRTKPTTTATTTPMTTTSPPLKISGRRKPERSTRVPIRRNKLQKNFSELQSVQLPPPDKNIGTTLPYNVTPVTESFLESPREPDTTTAQRTSTPTTVLNENYAETKSKLNYTSRNPRQKYQRKYNTWSPRKTKTKTTVAEKKSDDITKIVFNDTIDENSMEIKNAMNITDEYRYDNQTVLAIGENPIDDDKSTTIKSDFETDASVKTSISYGNVSSVEYEEVFTPLTRKSYVTSISFKRGNKTVPYYPMSTIPTKNDTSENKNSTMIESILQDFDLKHAVKANVSQIDESGEDFKVYRTEDGLSYTDFTTDDIDNITQKIIDHARSVNLAGSNSTN